MSKISDEKISIRHAIETDTHALSLILNEPEVLEFYPMTTEREVTDALKVWNFYMRQGSVYTIEVDSEPVGMAVIYVTNYQKLKKQALFAIVVGKKYRGMGLGTKLMTFILDKAKNEFGIRLLHLEMYEGNPAHTMYERFGFEYYARHEKFLKDAKGQYRSKVMMQMEL